jgi:hypothetical protein
LRFASREKPARREDCRDKHGHDECGDCSVSLNGLFGCRSVIKSPRRSYMADVESAHARCTGFPKE